MKTILVTGGSGFIGSNFIHSIMRRQNGIRVINLDKLTYSGNPENLKEYEDNPLYKFVHGSINDVDVVLSLLKDNQVTTVVNFAAESHVDRSIDSPEPFFQTNVMGTLSLLEASLDYWKSLSLDFKNAFKFIHVSTDEVFGSLQLEDPSFNELTPYSPTSPYAASKASSDHVVRSFVTTYGFPAIITNCSNNYGPYQFPEKIIPLVITNALNHESIPIYGDGSNVRDWLYVEDHCDALHLVLEKGRVGSSYNIGGQSELSNLNLVNALCDLLDKLKPQPSCQSYKELISFVPDRPGHDFRYSISINHINSELGWEPKHNIKTGLQKTVQWYLENESWCRALSKKYQGQRLGLKNES